MAYYVAAKAGEERLLLARTGSDASSIYVVCDERVESLRRLLGASWAIYLLDTSNPSLVSLVLHRFTMPSQVALQAEFPATYYPPLEVLKEIKESARRLPRWAGPVAKDELLPQAWCVKPPRMQTA